MLRGLVMNREQITKLIDEIQDAKNLGTLDARIAEECISALDKLIMYTDFAS
jgi:hypothetical protein